MPAKFIYYKKDGKQQRSCNINQDPDRKTNKGNATCLQCKGLTRGGGQCSRSTCLHTPYCWQHTRSILRLRVMKSKYLQSLRINSLGLYAWDSSLSNQRTAVFEKGFILRPQGDTYGRGLYGGEELSQDELDELYDYYDEDCEVEVEPTAPYGQNFWINDNHEIYDAACVRGVISYANSIMGKMGKNGFISKKKKHYRPRRKGEKRRHIYKFNAELLADGNIRFIRKVYHGQEILVSYGPDYFEGNMFDCNGNEVSAGYHSSHPQKTAGDPSLRISKYKSSR